MAISNMKNGFPQAGEGIPGGVKRVERGVGNSVYVPYEITEPGRGSVQQQSRNLLFSTDDGVRGPSPKYVAQEQDALRGNASQYMNAIDETRKAGIKPAAVGAPREEFDARAATIMAVNNRLSNEQRPSVA